MSARVLVLGLDSGQSSFLARRLDEGALPNLEGLMGSSAVSRLDGPLDTLPGAIWAELHSGISVARQGHFFTQDQLRTGEARWRPMTPEEAAGDRYYWSVASRAGCRVAVVDPPHAPLQPYLNGVQILEWGSHDRSRGFGLQLDPPEILTELGFAADDCPVWDSDAYPGTTQGYRRLLAELAVNTERLTALCQGVLGRESWDLFVGCFGACHSAGHRLWHVMDETHPEHDPSAPRDLRDGVERVFRGLDAAVGALVEAAGRNATVLLVASHGMGPAIGGPNLLPEVLVRLGMSSDRGAARGSALRRLQEQVKERTPARFVPALQRLASLPWMRRIQGPIGGMVFPLQSPATRACAIPNNRIGAIRLNLRGREPYGCIAPGAELEAVVAELTEELLALEHLEESERIVREVVRSEEAFGPGHHPDLPDLLVRFRRNLGPLDGCRSPRVGVVRAPARHARSPRTGDHTADSRIWLRAPGIAGGTALARGNVLDLAPTVLTLLGVPVPDDLDGQPLPGIA